MNYFEVGKLYHKEGLLPGRSPIMILEVLPPYQYPPKSTYAYQRCKVLLTTGECETLDLYVEDARWKKL